MGTYANSTLATAALQHHHRCAGKTPYVLSACILILVVLISAPQPAAAQSYPADCKPVGTQNCAPVVLTSWIYEIQCTLPDIPNVYPSERQAFLVAWDNLNNDNQYCVPNTWEWRGWASDLPDVDMLGDLNVGCPPPYSRPIPVTTNDGLFEIKDWSVYTRNRWTHAGGGLCNESSHNLGYVFRERSIKCPEGYADYSGGFCRQSDTNVDVGKNLGCTKKVTGQCSTGNPVNTTTGNKFQVETDYVGVGPNPLVFRRYYNSQAALSNSPNGLYRFTHDTSVSLTASFNSDNENGVDVLAIDSIGANWRHTYHRAVVLTEIVDPGTGQVTFRTASIYRQDGAINIFRNFNDQWIADVDVNLVLVEQIDGGGVTTGWQITTANDELESYDVAGRLQTISNRAGVTVSLAYDSLGRLDTVTDEFGRQLDFGYVTDPQPGVEWHEDSTLVNQIETITDPLGNVYTYKYLSDGNLEKVVYPDLDPNLDLAVREYKYEDINFPYALTGIVDENGDRFASYGYDGKGRANLTYHGIGVEIAGRADLTYNDSTYAQYYQIISVDVTEGLNSPQQRSHSSIPAIKLGVSKMNSATHGAFVSSYTYDAQGNVERYTDLNNNTLYRTYNSRNLETLRREAENDVLLQRDTVTTWHPNYRLKDVVTEPMRTTDYDYYPNGDLQRVTITSLNISGNEDLSTDGNRTRIWNYTYNAHGQITSIDGPRVDVADVTTFNYYDEPTCPVGDGKCGQLEYIINAKSQRTDFNAYYADGRLKKMTDPNGQTTEYEYDSRRQLTKVTASDGVTSRITQYGYDAAGQIDLVTLPSGLVLDYEWTSAHLLDSVSDNFGNKIDYDYDAHRNRNVEQRVDPQGVIQQALQTTYDEFDFVDAVTSGTLASGESITTNYDFDPLGNLKSMTDADLNVTNYSVDVLNRSFKTTDALLKDTDYEFDQQDNPVLVTAPNGAVTSLPNDGLGNLDREVSADRGTIDLDYDDAGNLKRKLDARGKLTTYEYDALNRLTVTTFADSSTITYQYDVGPNAIGRLNQITDNSGATNWTYNTYGDVKSKTQSIGSVDLATVYNYHPNGQLASMTLPSGKVVTYGYTAYQRTSVTVGATTVLSGATYEPFGAVNGWIWGDTTSHTRVFDTRGLLEYQTAFNDTQILGYDNVGRLNSIDDNSQGLAFDFDNIVPGDATFISTITPGTNRLANTPGPTAKTVTYDAAGNATNDGVHSYGYDDRGRFTSVDSGTTAVYEHNGQGQRVRKTVGTTATVLFVYDEAGHLIGEYDQSGNAVVEHVWFNDEPVAALDGTKIYYVHADHLGSPRIISNGNTVVWRWRSSPFGLGIADEDPDGDSNSFTYNLRFAGQYYDAETGLHYNYFRTYDPSTGRYLESDPIGLIGGPNTYSYALLNPISFYDPYGLWVPPSPPQWLVDGAAGFGDGLSGGITSWIRDQAGIDGGVNKCSSLYSGSRTTGNVASLTLGGGRLVYAGLAKGYSVTASSGAAASAGRSGLRRLFGGGGSLRPPNLSRYPTDAALRAAAGRTNPLANAAGAAAAGLGANDLANGDECECSQ